MHDDVNDDETAAARQEDFSVKLPFYDVKSPSF
jgi:hypothetical protein